MRKQHLLPGRHSPAGHRLRAGHRLLTMADRKQTRKRTWRRFAFPCALVLLALTSPVQAQESRVESDASGILDALKDRPIPLPGETSRENGTDIQQSVWCPEIIDEETREACWKAYRARLQYYETGLQHRSRVFWWQHMSTRLIFAVVLLLVGAGIFFAWIQFRHDLGAPGSATNESAKEHTVELSTSGIKVSSPVLGVIILTLSFAFFYLYLVYVYPIREIF